MSRKKFNIIVFISILFILITPQILKSINRVNYNFDEPCSCEYISNKYHIKGSKCYAGYNGIGQLKGYYIQNPDETIHILIGKKDDVNHQYKNKLKMIDSFEGKFKEYKFTIEYFTYKTNDSDSKDDIYNIFYLEKDGHVIYGSIPKFENSIANDYKIEIKNNIEMYLENFIYY